jgi:hypothetical protein
MILDTRSRCNEETTFINLVLLLHCEHLITMIYNYIETNGSMTRLGVSGPM